MVDKVSIKDQELLDIYKCVVNLIDDLFEYRYKNMSNEELKEEVICYIDQIVLSIKNKKG